MPIVAVDADSDVPEYGEQNGGEYVKKKYHKDGALVFLGGWRMVESANSRRRAFLPSACATRTRVRAISRPEWPRS